MNCSIIEDFVSYAKIDANDLVITCAGHGKQGGKGRVVSSFPHIMHACHFLFYPFSIHHVHTSLLRQRVSLISTPSGYASSLEGPLSKLTMATKKAV